MQSMIPSKVKRFVGEKMAKTQCSAVGYDLRMALPSIRSRSRLCRSRHSPRIWAYRTVWCIQRNEIHRQRNEQQLCKKILGCYEAEITPAVEEAISRNYRTMLDVGCAEGYYAVGLARGVPGSVVYAGVDEKCRSLCARLWVFSISLVLLMERT